MLTLKFSALFPVPSLRFYYYYYLIAEFYLVDRGLMRHRLPGFSSLGRLVILLRRVSAGSGTNGRAAVVVPRGRLPVSEVGSI